MKYKNLYFDLDQTLWDFKSNSELVLRKLCQSMFSKQITNPEEYLNIYYPINDELWELYRQNKITKSILRIKRFTDSLAHFGINEQSQIEHFCESYIENAPLQTILMPHTHEVLSYLKNKGYNLYILTNGFKEVQLVKMEKNKLNQYFSKMITSDEAGYQKPNHKIFEYALKVVNAKKKESIMIGDDVNTDILGASKFGMDTIYYNVNKIEHKEKPSYEINSLNELTNLL